MEPPRAAASQSPQSSGVLDLSCTYDISKSLLHPEPATATLEEDSSCALTWASPASSLNYTGMREICLWTFTFSMLNLWLAALQKAGRLPKLLLPRALPKKYVEEILQRPDISNTNWSPAGTYDEAFLWSFTILLGVSICFPGHRTSDCEDSEKIRLEDDERLSALSPSSSSSIVREQRSSTITSSPRLETNEDIDDAQLRANLDAFYELSSLPGDDEFSRQLTEKILELKQKNHLYALRSFQMGKIILRQEGTKVLQSSATDNVFSSTGETLNIKPVAGLSDDVIRFLKDRNSTKKGP